MNSESNEANTSQERRKYYRIEDYVYLSCKEITSDESLQKLLATLEGHVPNSFLASSSFESSTVVIKSLLHRIRATSKDIALALTAIDEKLNHMAKLLLLDQLSVGENTTTPVCLSAGGISFDNATRMIVNSLIELRLVIVPEMIGIMCVGRVVRSESLKSITGDKQWNIVVEFEHIRESDRDIIVKHILSIDAEQRREHKVLNHGES